MEARCVIKQLKIRHNYMKMTEKELIGKIRELRQIQPSKDWVSLTKSQILGKEDKYNNLISVFQILFSKPAYAGLVVVFVLFGLFGFSQNSLPGDLLYPIKKITEKSQAVFVSEEELPKYNLEIANKRLEELNEIAQTNQVKKLAPAISEFQANISEAAKSLAKVKGQDVEKIVAQTKKLEENKKKVEEVLATKILSQETEESLISFYKTQAEMLINDLGNQTLTEEKEEILNQMKKLFEEEKYLETLELYFISQ